MATTDVVASPLEWRQGRSISLRGAGINSFKGIEIVTPAVAVERIAAGS